LALGKWKNEWLFGIRPKANFDILIIIKNKSFHWDLTLIGFVELEK
jgi:hypothetical protein